MCAFEIQGHAAKLREGIRVVAITKLPDTTALLLSPNTSYPVEQHMPAHNITDFHIQERTQSCRIWRPK